MMMVTSCINEEEKVGEVEQQSNSRVRRTQQLLCLTRIGKGAQLYRRFVSVPYQYDTSAVPVLVIGLPCPCKHSNARPWESPFTTRLLEWRSIESDSFPSKKRGRK